jgi:hypothetical protein
VHFFYPRILTCLSRRREKAHATLTGILYLHPKTQDLSSDSLKQITLALRFLLGDSWLPRVTVAVISSPSGETPNDSLVSSLQEPTSPFYTLHAGGARIQAITLDPDHVNNLLLGYQLQSPQPLEFQTTFKFGRTWGINAYLEEGLGWNNDASLNSLARGARTTHRGQRRSTKTTREESESVTSRQQLERAIAESEMEMTLLRDQLEQTRSEYASLRSELQLTDNMEQNKIVQSLKGLNRSIENFGRYIAEHLVDNHVSPYSDDDTTLKALNLPEIKAQFHHREGTSSLVISSRGSGMPTEDFFDLAIRSILCKRLCKDIFLPFHPTLANRSSNDFINDLYKEVRCQGK